MREFHTETKDSPRNHHPTVILGINIEPSPWGTPMPKAKTSIAIDPDLLKWIESQVKSKRFASRSHAIEYAVNELRKRS